MSSDDCGVCIGGYEGDEAQFYAERMVTARKPHRCYECKDTIPPGQRYELVTGRWDGTFGRYRFCAICSEISRAFSCEGRNFGNLWDEVREFIFPEMKAGCINKLETAAAKQRLMDRWRAWLGVQA